MAITIRRTKHLDECDLNRIDLRNDAIMKLLNNKLIMRADNNQEGGEQIEEAFGWLRDNCQNFYSVRGPEADKHSVKYYIYFMNAEEMLLFATTFPQDLEEDGNG